MEASSARRQRRAPTRRSAPPGALAAAAALAALCGASWGPRAAEAGATDQEYQNWASKVYQQDDKEGVKRGEAIACAFCQISANAVVKQLELNKEKPRDERFSEEQTEEVLLDICESTAPKVAKSMNGYKKDALMLCRRVVKENLSDMMDAASLGEDMNMFCRENKICPFGMQDMVKMLEAFGQYQADQKKKEEEAEEEL